MKSITWLVLFITMQIADGILTYHGMVKFGIGAEGNPLLATWMLLVGAVPALVGAKIIAVFAGSFLYFVGKHFVVAILASFYLFAAILPWLHIFAQP